MAGTSPAMTRARMQKPRLRRGFSELLQHFLGYRLRLNVPAVITHYPHPLLAAFGAQLALEQDAMLHREARRAEADRALNCDVIAESRRLEKLRASVDQRKSGEVVSLEILIFRHAVRVLKQ